MLTILTQIGGLIWVINECFFKLSKYKVATPFKFVTFISIYIFCSLLIVPKLAKINGRVPLPIFNSKNLKPHTLITPMLNRHYVKPRLKEDLGIIANRINQYNKHLKLSYLDANFPFIDGFPLLPHLSHDDGKKVDLSFYYTKNNVSGNFKPSNSGYGSFIEPLKNETNYATYCKSKGFWYYDFAKYFTLGVRNDLEFDLISSKFLIDIILRNPNTQKVFLEPNLKKRLHLSDEKIRFQGCHSVRHDDHLHLQIN